VALHLVIENKTFVIFIKMIEAVMFDIDDTLIKTRNGKPIPEMVELLTRCKMVGYRVVIITARPWYESNVERTKRELERNGIQYDEIYFSKPQDKTLVKKQLMKKGYKFLLSVGDQPTDLTDSTNYINTSIFFRN
jgi:hydroxymethylpyrimidine pyrophosphatase-like HAD family hydrolase